MKILYNSFIWIIIFLSACTSLSPREKAIKENLYKKINIKVLDSVIQGDRKILFSEWRKPYNYFSLVYLKRECGSCYNTYISWQKHMDSIALNKNYTVLFVIEGDSYRAFIDNIPDYYKVNNECNVILDTKSQFRYDNIGIPWQVMKKSFLVDKSNKIRLVGEPFSSPEIMKLYQKVCR